MRSRGGAQDGAYWSAWALTHWSSLALSGLLCAAIARYPFPHTSFGLMLLLLWLVAAALLAFAYFLSTLFAKSRVAGMASAMLYAVAMVPGWALLTQVCYPSQDCAPASSIHSNTASCVPGACSPGKPNESCCMAV